MKLYKFDSHCRIRVNSVDKVNSSPHFVDKYSSVDLSLELTFYFRVCKEHVEPVSFLAILNKLPQR